jgi:hypothetical protein
VSWRRLLADNRAERHEATKQELDDVRAAVERNLRDASIKQLSADNRFGLAYEAALLLAKMVVACAGYRVKGPGAHKTMFDAVEVAMGAEVSDAALYFDRCRRKRNDLSYDAAGIISETEAEELLEEAGRFRVSVESWISKYYPQFKA